MCACTCLCSCCQSLQDIWSAYLEHPLNALKGVSLRALTVNTNATRFIVFIIIIDSSPSLWEYTLDRKEYLMLRQLEVRVRGKKRLKSSSKNSSLLAVVQFESLSEFSTNYWTEKKACERSIVVRKKAPLQGNSKG